MKGVGILIVTSDGKFLSIEEKTSNRKTGKKKGARSFPMETVQGGESYQQALKRLLQEEVVLDSVAINSLKKLCQVEIRNGVWLHSYLLHLPKSITIPVGSSTDVTDPVWVDIDQVLKNGQGLTFRPGVRETLLEYKRYLQTGSTSLLEEYRGEIEQSLRHILPRKFTKKTLESVLGKTEYDLDINAINKAINEPLWDFLSRGGKRWRPALFLMIVELLDKDPRKFVDLAVIFELIHNGTLIVDDIEDLSLHRRGKPTLHLIYGEDIAINAGNLLYFLPLKVLEKYRENLSQHQIVKIYQVYIDEMLKLSFGQSTDIAWHKGLVNDFQITERAYLQMCAFKTGGLSRMACKIAAIVGGGDERLIEVFGRFGESLGVIFQIQDDILNITESALSDKKGLGDDVTEGKRSLPVIYALNNLPKIKAKRIIEILLLHTTDQRLIQEAINLINEGKGIVGSQKTMEKLFTDTWNRLEPLLEKSEKKDKLYQLARFLMRRQV